MNYINHGNNPLTDHEASTLCGKTLDQQSRD